MLNERKNEYLKLFTFQLSTYRTLLSKIRDQELRRDLDKLIQISENTLQMFASQKCDNCMTRPRVDSSEIIASDLDLKIQVYSKTLPNGSEIEIIWRSLKGRSNQTKNFSKLLNARARKVMCDVDFETWEETEADDIGFELFLRAGFLPEKYWSSRLREIWDAEPFLNTKVCMDSIAKEHVPEKLWVAYEKDKKSRSEYASPCWQLYNLTRVQMDWYRMHNPKLLQGTTTNFVTERPTLSDVLLNIK